MKSRFYSAKMVFVDSIDFDDYIELDSSVRAFEKLKESIEKPLKMILVFGRPGTGKSILLNRLQTKLKHQKEIHYFDTPTVDEKEFFLKLYGVLNQNETFSKEDVTLTMIIEQSKKIRGEREIVILLDEAQIYSSEMMEKIRLISDTRAVKFVVSLHKTDNEELVAKEHFKSRIWEVIELKNATVEDQQSYVHKKLLKKNLFEIANSIKSNEMKLIHAFTKGNYRECNKLMYTIFEISEYYDTNEPTKIRYDKVSSKIIEMAALKLGYLHA